MIFLSDLNHDLNQRFKSNDLNHNNPAAVNKQQPIKIMVINHSLQL